MVYLIVLILSAEQAMQRQEALRSEFQTGSCLPDFEIYEQQFSLDKQFRNFKRFSKFQNEPGKTFPAKTIPPFMKKHLTY